ncbi:glycyl-tRNA synthetase [Punctularia strigosozonata HHB-11173 SS5]|uniref:glycyl-tRNA synthetase n=1 Tax=Punctularia strigosozonata (strain HHB-11173) TaxID=741275 RepID=UPI0004416B9E|nr:glycyl-tRNA synthetase [Punctularia strigosozonata HHB-11173 SS5]EIN05586.1 glycyl-tRNA synthetase [Punctularia strigosozonata HHB-11173 SS5]
MSEVKKTVHPFDKARLEATLARRFFYAPAFEIYGGVAGLYDYGPPGSALQANIIAEWRRHFIIEENMLELDTTIMTPAPVFETSGHVARFADWMVKDLKTGEVLRADHLVKNVIEARLVGDKEARGAVAEPAVESEKDKKKKKKAAKAAPVKLADELVKEYEFVLAQLDNYSGPELGELIRKYAIRNPDTDNEIGEPQQFNLMFGSSIGPTGQHPGFLRPETAQGHFLNFSRLLEFNYGRVPFASACIGRSFRNEISPRAGLLRVREFTMAEIEHYVDPEDKSHPRFKEVRDITLALLDRHVQVAGSSEPAQITIGEAVDRGVVANETLGYFLARIYLFLVKIGIDPQRLRFRQHMANEMAHYATDCWDAEIHNSTGWTECVGCADRAAYDLSVHAKKTGAPLVVRQALSTPISREAEVVEFNKKNLGKTFGKDSAVIQKIVGDMSEEQLIKLKGELAQGTATITAEDGRQLKLTPGFLTIERKTIKQHVREFIPNVIEPSFGLGRILYTLLEHSFWSREQDVERGVLSLPALVAPTKVLIVPLSAKEEFVPLVREVHSKLRAAGVFSRVDDSNTSIGKRYARNDELGTPFGVTLDFASVQNRTMTLRERDTTTQLIGDIDEVVKVVIELVEGTIEWKEACGRLSVYTGVQAVE